MSVDVLRFGPDELRVLQEARELAQRKLFLYQRARKYSAPRGADYPPAELHLVGALAELRREAGALLEYTRNG